MSELPPAITTPEYAAEFEYAIPGLSETDYGLLSELASYRTLCIDGGQMQWALDEAHINPHTTYVGLQTGQYPTADRREEELRILDPNAMIALGIAKKVADSYVAWRITIHPNNPELAMLSPDLLTQLKTDPDFLQRYYAWQHQPSERHLFLRMQSRLIGRLAQILTGVAS